MNTRRSPSLPRVRLVSKRAHEIRKSKLLTQVGVANQARVSMSTVWLAFQGRPISVRSARAIADVLGVPLAEILQPVEQSAVGGATETGSDDSTAGGAAA